MAVDRQHVRTFITLIVATLMTVAACGSVAGTPSSAPSISASSTSASYTSVAFKVPLTVTVDPLLNSPPNPDSAGLLSWDAVGPSTDRVRFLAPAEVYPPGSTKPQAPPTRYLDYLRGQAANGAAFANESTITVGGRPATLMTVTTTTSLDGSLGCPALGADQAEGCFGIQPEYALRMVVIDMGQAGTLLAWARTDNVTPDMAFFAMFERMLASVRFN